jgi:hypothetical protein
MGSRAARSVWLFRKLNGFSERDRQENFAGFVFNVDAVFKVQAPLAHCMCSEISGVVYRLEVRVSKGRKFRSFVVWRIDVIQHVKSV